MLTAQKIVNAVANPVLTLKSLFERIGFPEYKRFVGPPALYETLGEYQFDLLKGHGLEPRHSLVDVGCGSLRAGKFFISYLDPGHYFGIEPEIRVLQDGIRHNLTQQMIEEKKPVFSHEREFQLSVFNRQFDFVLAHSILTHTSQVQVRKFFTEVAKVLSNNGCVLANYNEGLSDYSGDEWVYPGFVTYTLPTMLTLAKSAGVNCVRLNIQHPTHSSWLLGTKI